MTPTVITNPADGQPALDLHAIYELPQLQEKLSASTQALQNTQAALESAQNDLVTAQNKVTDAQAAVAAAQAVVDTDNVNIALLTPSTN